MKKAIVSVHNVEVGFLLENAKNSYEFRYHEEYTGEPISWTMPVRKATYYFDEFPAFFDGLLPEGLQLEGLLKGYKIDRTDYFKQLVIVGADMVGSVTVKLASNE